MVVIYKSILPLPSLNVNVSHLIQKLTILIVLSFLCIRVYLKELLYDLSWAECCRKCDEDGLPLESSGESVFILGGANPFDFDSSKNSQRIFQYQTRSNCWRQCGYMPEPLFYHCALYFHGKIYIAGQYKTTSTFNWKY